MQLLNIFRHNMFILLLLFLSYRPALLCIFTVCSLFMFDPASIQLGFYKISVYRIYIVTVSCVCCDLAYKTCTDCTCVNCTHHIIKSHIIQMPCITKSSNCTVAPEVSFSSCYSAFAVNNFWQHNMSVFNVALALCCSH